MVSGDAFVSGGAIGQRKPRPDGSHVVHEGLKCEIPSEERDVASLGQQNVRPTVLQVSRKHLGASNACQGCQALEGRRDELVAAYGMVLTGCGCNPGPDFIDSHGRG